MEQTVVLVGAGVRVVGDGFGLQVEAAPVPDPGRSEVVVRVAWSGICGSDLHALSHGIAEGVVPGHETSGRVVASGMDVADLAEGDAVVVLPRRPCGRCGYCERGRGMLCQAFVRPRSGGWATHQVVDRALVLPLPVNVPLRRAALAEPMACALHAVSVARVSAGATVLVVGAGPIGLLAVYASARRGARVSVVEPSGFRRNLALRLGAVDAVPPGGLPVDGLGDGPLFDAVIEAAGRPDAVTEALWHAGPGATVAVAGVHDPEVAVVVFPRLLFDRSVGLVGSWGIEETMGDALILLADDELDILLTHDFPLERVSEAVAAAASAATGKVLLVGSVP